MTKLDKENFEKMYCSRFIDVHEHGCGFVNSTVVSSLVLSAGMNSSAVFLYRNFTDFYPNESKQ
jgi:hypothetical protein